MNEATATLKIDGDNVTPEFNGVKLYTVDIQPGGIGLDTLTEKFLQVFADPEKHRVNGQYAVSAHVEPDPHYPIVRVTQETPAGTTELASYTAQGADQVDDLLRLALAWHITVNEGRPHSAIQPTRNYGWPGKKIVSLTEAQARIADRNAAGLQRDAKALGYTRYWARVHTDGTKGFQVDAARWRLATNNELDANTARDLYALTL